MILHFFIKTKLISPEMYILPEIADRIKIHGIHFQPQFHVLHFSIENIKGPTSDSIGFKKNLQTYQNKEKYLLITTYEI